jgi:hypothetical protein
VNETIPFLFLNVAAIIATSAMSPAIEPSVMRATCHESKDPVEAPRDAVQHKHARGVSHQFRGGPAMTACCFLDPINKSES